MKKTYIYDYETIKNCFLAVYINNKNTKDIVKFEVSDFENQFEDYIKFQKHLIKSKNYIVSFNGLNFDSQVAVYCLSEYRNLKNLTGGEIAREIFLFVQKLLDLKNEKGWSIYKIADLPFNAMRYLSVGF